MNSEEAAETLPQNVEEVSLFSDTCSRQNRNQYIAALFMFILQTFNFKIIKHKFLEKGQTQMEVDSMHSAFEYSQKQVPIFIMRDWMNIFKMARSKRNKNKNADKYACQEFNDLKNLKKVICLCDSELDT
jgi:hypothetical protein